MGDAGNNLGFSLKFNNREDWLAWRKDRVCASDIPIILGQSELGSIEDLIEEKIDGIDRRERAFCTARAAMETGRAIEADATALGIAEVEKLFSEKAAFVETQVCLESFEEDVKIGATLDALLAFGLEKNKNSHFVVLEVKVLKTLHEDPPQEYVSQVVWQEFLLTEQRKSLRIVDRERFHISTFIFEATPDLKEFKLHQVSSVRGVSLIDGALLCEHLPDRSSMLESAKSFYEYLQRERAHKEAYGKFSAEFIRKKMGRVFETKLLPKDIVAQKAYVEAEERFNIAKKELEAAKKLLLLGLDEEVSYGGQIVDIVRSEVKGRVDYAKSSYITTMDLNKLRKSPTIRTQIKVKKLLE